MASTHSCAPPRVARKRGGGQRGWGCVFAGLVVSLDFGAVSGEAPLRCCRRLLLPLAWRTTRCKRQAPSCFYQFVILSGANRPDWLHLAERDTHALCCHLPVLCATSRHGRDDPHAGAS
jgi:hypothetical protein